MTLHFPNASRHYNSTKRCVSFRGYDSVFEILFDLDEDVLRCLSREGEALSDETLWLETFDTHRARIEEVAGAVYARRRGNLHRLTVSDF